MNKKTWLLMAGALSLFTPNAAQGQIRGSERATVAQTIDGTIVTVQYARPAARGRVLFGELVAFGEPWTGANWATTFETNRPVRLNGVEIPAGEYSLWMVPDADEWRVFLDERVELYHFQKPDSAAGQIHLAARPRSGPHVETLTWSFPAVTGAGAMLNMQWGETVLPFEVVVEPSEPIRITAEERAPYLGTYDLEIAPGLGWPTTARLEVFEENGMLRGRLPFPVHPGDELTFDMVPAGLDRFNGGHYRDGKLFNIEMGGAWEFDLDRDRAVRVRMRGVEGSVFGEGARIES
jgi:hypothetical protein